MRLKRYNKTLDYSYTFGMYPTIELLRAKPDKVVQIITHSKLSDEVNFNNLVIIRPAADIFHPDTIRASMGALFGINFELFDDINRYLEVFSIHNQYLFMTEGQDTLDGVSFSPPYSLVFGSEPSGLPPRYSELGNTVRIAQSGRVDSLNLAISASIVFHHLYSRYH